MNEAEKKLNKRADAEQMMDVFSKLPDEVRERLMYVIEGARVVSMQTTERVS